MEIRLAEPRVRLDGAKLDWPAVRRGGLLVGIVWLGLSAEIVLTNVVFPAKDDDTVEILASYLCVFAALCGIGVVAARAGAARKVQVLAGAVAGAVLGALTIGSFAVVDNVWLDVVSRQPQKIAGFAHSGAASMRDYVNHGLIGPAVYAVVALGIMGAIMAAIGGAAANSTGASPKAVAVRRPGP